jgi:hypothetical protein
MPVNEIRLSGVKVLPTAGHDHRVIHKDLKLGQSAVIKAVRISL